MAQNPITRAFLERMAKEQKSRSTIENYSRALNDFLSAFPDRPFSELIEADESRIADYVEWLWKREAKQRAGQPGDRRKITYVSGSKLAPATIRRRISALRCFSRWSIRLRHRRDSLNPVREGIRGRERGLVPVPPSVPWIPDERQWRALWKQVLTNCALRDQIMVLLAHDGALRREEIVRLRVDDIDWQMHTGAIRAEITKNTLPGAVVLSHPTWFRLKEDLEGDRAARITCYGGDWNGPSLLSDSQRTPGQPSTKWTVKDLFDHLPEDLPLPHLTPHKMRQLMLPELKKSGMELLEVSRYGRHRKLSSTEIDLHPELTDLARQVNQAHRPLETLLAQVEGEAHEES